MHPLDALDAATIRRGLAAQGETLAVEVRGSCESTNTVLLDRLDEEAPLLLLAEKQTAGRGRRGRRWQSAPGGALTFSMRWRFGGPAGRLRGLSLAAGVGIACALRDLGAAGVRLKWPNDLLAPLGYPDERLSGKLGGVLIETRSGGGGTDAVIGIGLNCARMPGLERRLRRPVATLDALLDPLPARNAIAVRLAAELARTLRRFDRGGFAAFRAEWSSMHAHPGERLKVRMGDGRSVAGTADGVAADGALLLRNRRGLHAVASGSVVRQSPMAGRAP